MPRVQQEIELTVVTESTTFGYRGRTRGSVIRAEGFEMARVGDRYYFICAACIGSGFRREYAGLYGGQCFPCGATGLEKKVGEGTPEEIVKVLRRRAAARTRREAAAKRQEDAKAAARAAWGAANPGVQAAIDAVVASRDEETGKSPYSATLVDMCLRNTYYIPTEKQAAAIERMFPEETRRIQDRAKEKQARTWIGEVGGKVTFTGKLIFCRGYSNDLGSFTIMRWVTEDGNTVSWKRSGWHEQDPGAVMTVSATVKEHTDSEKYGRETTVTRGKIVSAE